MVMKALPFHDWLTIVLTYLRSGNNYVIIAIMKIYCFNDFLFLFRLIVNIVLENMLRNKIFLGELKRVNTNLP